MSFLDKLKKALETEPTEDYFKRNSGKKIQAKVLLPTDYEIKTAQNENHSDK